MTTMPSVPIIERLVDLPSLIERKSHFLLGSRQTGKTFLIRHTLGGVRVYDLLDSSTFLMTLRWRVPLYTSTLTS